MYKIIYKIMYKNMYNDNIWTTSLNNIFYIFSFSQYNTSVSKYSGLRPSKASRDEISLKCDSGSTPVIIESGSASK